MATKTRAALKADAATVLATNTAGNITAADLRGEIDNLADSAIFAEDLTAAISPDAFYDIRDEGTSPLSIAADRTFTVPIRIPRGYRIVPAAGVNVHFQQGYDADDWNWCFDISAAGSSVTGDEAPRGYTTPQHFGANPRDNTVDDRIGIEAAIEYSALNVIREEYAEAYPVLFPYPGQGKYYLTKTRPIYVARTVRLYANVTPFGRSYSGTEILAANGLDAVMLAFYPGGASAPDYYEPSNAPDHPTVPGIGKKFGALRMSMYGLTFGPAPSAVVRQGFVHNVIAFLERCTAGGFTEAGFKATAQTSGSINNIFAHPGIGNTAHTDPLVPATAMVYNGSAPVWGNVNGSSYDFCYAAQSAIAVGVNGGSHGFVTTGNNAGTVGYYKCDANNNLGVGFLENSTIGSEYISNHTAQNCFDVGHNGNVYVCIKGHTSGSTTEPGIGADWTTYWMTNTSATGDVAWATAEFYHPTCGMNVSSASSRTSIISHYTEGGIEVGLIVRNTCAMFGGNAPERTPWHPEYNQASVQAFGSRAATPVYFVGRTTPDDDETEFGMSMGSFNGYTNGRIAQFGDKRDDATFGREAVRFAWNNIRGRYEWSDASNSNRSMGGFTGSGFTGTGYGAITQSYMWANGLYIGDGSLLATRVSRQRAVFNLAGITAAVYGPAVKGDIWFYTNLVAGGKVGAVCTTAGDIGTTAVIKEFGAIDA